MPSYKTHSIHGELVFLTLRNELYIDKELLKLFCMGPDAIMLTDYKTFDYQHAHKTGDFFKTMISLIKKRRLQFNSEVMAFLYGQLDHFVLDAMMHPLIYYGTEDYPSDQAIPTHGIVEMWMDDYVVDKYKKDNQGYYSNSKCDSPELKALIDEVYQKVYGVKNESHKYSLGFRLIKMFDSSVRCNPSGFFSWLMKKLPIGDISYHIKNDKVKPFLNPKHLTWRDPETNIERHDSFDDLWYDSLEISRRLIEDVNNYLYYGQKLENPLLNNISYNTGLSCRLKQKLRFVKKYKKAE